MILYYKYKNKKNITNTPIETVKPTRPPLTEENKAFLKLLNLQVKRNV